MYTLLNRLAVSFSRVSLTLFENISFSIGAGDRLGFVGHYGSGKSSLLSLLSDKEQPDEGEIRIPGDLREAIVLWGKTYDNEKLARKAKSMQQRVERLKQEQMSVSQGSGLELHLQADSMRAKSLLTIEDLQIGPS